MFIAKRVLLGLQRPFEIAGHEVSINASIGIATGPDSGRRAEDLTDAADRAMYMAKRAGRGTIRVFEAQIPPEEIGVSPLVARERDLVATLNGSPGLPIAVLARQIELPCQKSEINRCGFGGWL